MSNSTQILSLIPADPLTGSISTPIYQTATFVQQAPGVHKGFDYARTSNPTRLALENLVAGLELGHSAYAFATGLAAIDAVLKLLKSGDEIIAVDDIYGGAYRLFTHIYSGFGIKVHYCDTTNPAAILPQLNERTRFIWLESPTNPTLKISDIARIATIAKNHCALLVVDNTFASPIAQKPLLLGADIVIHSATKYLAGHSDLVAGLVVAANPEVAERIKFIQNASGAILGPQDCFLCIRGIETAALRVRTQSETALKIAHFLQQHPLVSQVHYPGLSSHKNHDVAAAQQHNLFGGVLSFSFQNDNQKAALKFLQSTKFFHLAESLGGVKSLCCLPAEMTHKSIPAEKRTQSGISDSLVRLSCGIEDCEDLIEDLKQALQAAESAYRVHEKAFEFTTNNLV